MKNLALIVSVLVFTNFGVNAQELKDWYSWNEAIDAYTNKQAKKLFIDVYTDWCGWCKKMDASTFQDPEIKQILEKHYYGIKLDAEMKDTILFNNHAFYNINPNDKRGVHTLAASLLESNMSYPSFVILDENFNRVYIIKGFQDVEKLKGVLLFFANNEHIGYQKYLEQSKGK